MRISAHAHDKLKQQYTSREYFFVAKHKAYLFKSVWGAERSRVFKWGKKANPKNN